MKKKLTAIAAFLLILFCLFCVFSDAPKESGESLYNSMAAAATEAVETTESTTEPETSAEAAETRSVVCEDDSAASVAAYIHACGCLPDFYMTKNEAKGIHGWEGGALDAIAPGMCIGGDRYNNYEGQLPEADGRYYTECDIDTIGSSSRGAKRIVFSNDGLIYYTEDHYETFELLYGEP